MNEIMLKVKNSTLYEVYDLKAIFTQKDVYKACNEEIINRLKVKKYDVDTIELILKTFILGENDLQYLEQSMNLAYLLRNVEGVVLSKVHVDIDKIRTLYTDFIKRIEIINKQIKEVLPDKEKASEVLHGYKDIVSIYEEAKKYNEVMTEMLDIHQSYDEPTLEVENISSFKVYSLLDKEECKGRYYIEDYITLFYDYFDMVLDVLEAFINYYESLFTIEYVQEEGKYDSIDPNLYDDPKKVKVLLNHTIFELYDILENENEMGVEYYDRDELSEMALQIVEERFRESLFDKDSLDVLEKALLLAFEEENVKKAWIYISMIINQIEDFDPSADVLNLASIEGELSKKTLELFNFDIETLFDEMDEVDEFVLQSLVAMEGKEVLHAKVEEIAKIFATLLDRYYDYIQNAEEELEEEYVSMLLNKFNIVSEDPLDYIASVVEYYEDYDHKLFKFNWKLRYM